MSISLDNDDNGETAAGNRLAHLLQILVSLTYRSRCHADCLGADRFKHINQAARSALELGGFLDLGGDKKSRGMKKALYH